MISPLQWWRERQAQKRQTAALIRIVDLLRENERDMQETFVGMHEVAADALLAALSNKPRESDGPGNGGAA